MRSRMIIIPIDSIAALLADYASGIGFPPDGKPVTWKYNPVMRKLALVVEADSLDGNQPPEEVRFTLKRTYLVG